MMYKFQPLLKSTLWGGDKIIPFKHLDLQQERVGESWEISGVKDNETLVSEGPCAGRKLKTKKKKMNNPKKDSSNFNS